MLEEVLRPFSQQEIDGYRRRHEGAGLGLTLASKLTKMLGGDLEIHSKIEDGTTIELTFPETQSNKN
jgi:signal transduction histidine kinase